MLHSGSGILLRRSLIYAISALTLAALACAAKPAEAANPDNAKLVNQIFRDVLLRPATASELALWTHRLNVGGSVLQVAGAVQRLPAHRYQQVRRMFTKLLDRQPTKDEMARFAGELIAGSTAEHIVAEIMALDEFYLGRGGGTDGGFVDAVFLFATGDYPNASDKANFVALLRGHSNETVARMIENTEQSQHHFARAFYNRLCRHAAEEEEAAYFCGILGSGQRLERMVGEIMSTQDY